MNYSPFQNSSWYQAITLRERILSFHENPKNLSNFKSDTDTSYRRFEQWKTQVSSEINNDLTQYLVINGVTHDEFLYLLGESTEKLQKRLVDIPSWLTEIEQAFSSIDFSNPYKLPSPELLSGTKIAGFLYVIEPLIQQAHRRLSKKIQTLIEQTIDLPFDVNNIVKILFANLPIRLLGMLNRTIVLELHVARLQGKLQGDSSQDRFQHFLKYLRQHDKAIALLQEYPVLARQIEISIDQWVTYSWEFLQHLCADWNDIHKRFSPDRDLGLLVKLEGGVGDLHQGGRSVLIAKFDSGFQIVYKPRNLAIDIHFQELLTWIDERGNHPSFRKLKILNRDFHGWVEFIKAESCSSKEEVRRFYQRQGGYLALLYVLEAIDFHSENLIASAEHPVLIDLEALFHPRIQKMESLKSTHLADYKMFSSVLRVQMLPERLLSKADYEGFDISGLGDRDGQLSPDHIPYLEAEGTDEIKVSRQRMTIIGTSHRPTFNNNNVKVIDYTEEIVAGFANIYRLLWQHRDELLSQDSPLNRFADDEVRVIMRPTRFYNKLLTESFHPNFLQNALDRDLFFERLWFGVNDHSQLVKIIPSEREQLWQGDIPMFITSPNSRNLCSVTGEQFLNFFKEPSMESVKRRLEQLSEEDLAQQIWFTRAAISTLAMEEETAKWPTYQLTEPQTKAHRERLLTVARSIGDRLEWLAIRGDEDATWIGLNLSNEGFWSLSPLDLDLYNGIPGVVLFLAYLGENTGQERYTELARAGLTTIQHLIDRSKLQMKTIGFGGWGGVIYALTQLGVLWNQPKLLDDAEEIVNLLPILIENDELLDIISGSAGCIGALVSLYRCRASQKTLTAAIQCGDRLIAQAKPLDIGIGWIQKGPQGIGENPLAGFSHGAAGMAWALLEVFALTGENRFYQMALDAIAYERSLFSAEFSAWRDLRSLGEKENDSQPMTAWCNGSPGIGLARLKTLSYLKSAEIRSEIIAALENTLAYGFGGNHCLCHGDLGNLELLLQASLTLEDPKWKTQVDRLTAIILESIEKHGWLCGVPLGVETPGLMTGLAGIGYQLLRLAAPDIIPSVLVLEPPKVFQTKN